MKYVVLNVFEGYVLVAHRSHRREIIKVAMRFGESTVKEKMYEIYKKSDIYR